MPVICYRRTGAGAEKRFHLSHPETQGKPFKPKSHTDFIKKNTY